MTDTGMILKSISGYALIWQTLTIIVIFLLGFLFIQMIRHDISDTWQLLLAYPTGLSMFGIVSILLLSMGIEFNRTTLLLFGSVMVAELFLMFKKQGSEFMHVNRKKLLAGLAAAAVLAFISSSGLLSVSVDNDSLYYYSAFPQVIVNEQAYKAQYDVFMTDVGPMTVIINTLPYLFGFFNTFGIQHMLNMNFILIFLAALYEELTRHRTQKGAAAIAAFATVFLATSAAYLTTAKWIMAGDYFMVFFFLVMYFGYREGMEETRHQDVMLLLTMYTLMLSMLRMEGVVMALFLILCLSALSYSSEELFRSFLFPLGFEAFVYYFMVFVRLQVKPLYAFLTPVKALLIMAAIILMQLYVMLLRGRDRSGLITRAEHHMNLAVPAALTAVNAVMLMIDHSRYLHNFRTFYLNVRLMNGWGYFGYVFFAAIIAAVVMAVKDKDHSIGFFDMVMICFILVAVAAAWGRGDRLQVGAGDSGNRVMLTAVPVIVYAMTLRLDRATDLKTADHS